MRPPLPFLLLAALIPISASAAEPTPRQLSQFTVRDATRSIEWLRCAAGQTWNGNTCAGEARLFSYEEATRAAELASAELGGRWRLPSREELESLLCAPCGTPQIDARTFPHSPAATFWSSTTSWYSSAQHWSVNFRTGVGAGRNPPGMRHHVRLVRELPAK